MSLKGKSAIVGYAEMTPLREPGDKSVFGILGEMARGAIADAGLEKNEIDGLLTGTGSQYSIVWPSVVAEYLNIKPKYLDHVDIAGSTSAGMVWRAAAAIEAGMCNNVLCLIGSKMFRLGKDELTIAFPYFDAQFDLPYGTTMATGNFGYAMIARRHMHEFGTTPEQMAKIAVDQRKSACKNPAALFGNKEITIDDVLNSRMIVDPLHLLEIVSPCTGGGAFIVSSAERAKRGPNRPVYLLGAGEAGGHLNITYASSLTTSLVKVAAETAYKNAGLSPEHMDFVQIYDCYPITVLITMEDAGFCRKGDGGPFVAEHDLSYKGDFPCNTHGGQLSFGQPGLAGGMSQVIEAVRQLMGRAGERQLKDATIGYVNGNGGIMSLECSVVLGIQ